jgi:hypothetical protein
MSHRWFQPSPKRLAVFFCSFFDSEIHFNTQEDYNTYMHGILGYAQSNATGIAFPNATEESLLVGCAFENGYMWETKTLKRPLKMNLTAKSWRSMTNSI